MLLTIDVGNTNITMGVFDGEFLPGMFRMTTKRQRTSDEYGMTICGILEHRGDRSEADRRGDHRIRRPGHHAFPHKRYHQVPAHHAGDCDAGVGHRHPGKYREPFRTGPDRIVNAVAGYEIAKGPAIVIDFGTATTYDLIGPDGTLEACIIAPGIETAGRSLWGGAAMLPSIQIRKPESILARETVSGMQGGLVFGAIGQTEYIVKRMKEESGWEEAYVIATGGLGKIIAAETECIDLYDPQLTLNGLRLIYDRIKEQ